MYYEDQPTQQIPVVGSRRHNVSGRHGRPDVFADAKNCVLFALVCFALAALIFLAALFADFDLPVGAVMFFLIIGGLALLVARVSWQVEYTKVDPEGFRRTHAAIVGGLVTAWAAHEVYEEIREDRREDYESALRNYLR